MLRTLALLLLAGCSRQIDVPKGNNGRSATVAIATVVNDRIVPRCSAVWIGYSDMVTVRHCAAPTGTRVTWATPGDDDTHSALVVVSDQRLAILRVSLPPQHEHDWIALSASPKNCATRPVSVFGFAIGYGWWESHTSGNCFEGDLMVATLLPKGFSGSAAIASDGIAGICDRTAGDSTLFVGVDAIRTLWKTAPPIEWMPPEDPYFIPYKPSE